MFVFYKSTVAKKIAPKSPWVIRPSGTIMRGQNVKNIKTVNHKVILIINGFGLPGNVLLSQDPSVQVPSALEGLTVV
uniref:hypothetical protein n=1 Tax=Paenibacillus terreus TaxID=1387834 RepID=UPI0035CCF2CB